MTMDSAARNVHAFLDLRKSSGHKVMAIGNGGSAAIAAHMQNDLSNAAAIRALSFQDIPTLTAMTNDFGQEEAYARFVQHWADAADLLVAISSSGASENILRAVQAARKIGCSVITFSGFAPTNQLRQKGDINFYVPASDYGFVETLHAVLAHYFTDLIKTGGIEE
ncbi:MAG: SIS domain-containing protein [Deltaproteobacteria bacterium]|nr:SIS domain-containing protein [Deltaproteobacteria bacterium]